MKAVQCKDFSDDLDQIMFVEDNVSIPKLTDEYSPTLPIHPLIQMATKADRKTHMIIRTLAVALAPGDYRVVSGRTRQVQGPPSLPFIPGSDCCGIVVEVQPSEHYFKPGDLVAVRFSNAPRDALGEYSRVSSTVCEKVDGATLSPIQAACLASASPATQLAEYINKGDRVLIFGAGGGIGSHVCQLARNIRGASFVCGVSANPQRLLDAPLNCDKAIDYTMEDVFSMSEFQNKPFDLIIDLACGGWLQLEEMASKGIPPIVKSWSNGGRFVTPTSDNPSFEAHSLLPLIRLLVIKPMMRSLWSWIWTRRYMPLFVNANDCLPNDRSIITRTLDLVYQGKLEAIIDGPYDMTTEGAREAFKMVQSRHGKGKVVIKVCDNE